MRNLVKSCLYLLLFCMWQQSSLVAQISSKPEANAETPPATQNPPLPPTTSPGLSENKVQFLEDSGLEEIGPVQQELYVLAEPFTHVTPFVGPRLSLVSGDLRFAPVITGGAPGTKLDLNDDLFMGREQTGIFFGVDVQHSFFRISLAYSFNGGESTGNINRPVVVAGVSLQSGSQTTTTADTHRFLGNIGYTLLAEDWGGVGIRLGINYSFINFTSRFNGFRADDPTNPFVSLRLNSNLFIPMPTLGGYFDFAAHERAVLRTQVDVMFYDISRRRLTNVTFSLEPRYFLTATQQYYGYFRFQYEYFKYDFTTRQIDGLFEVHAFSFLFGAGIRF